MHTLINVQGKPDYAEIIHMIDTECFPNDCWSRELIEKELSGGRDIYLVYKDGSEVVAYLNASYVMDTAELNRIAVKQKYRRKGIANTLLDALTDFLKSCGCTRLLLEVRSQNISALSLYKKYGFKSDAVRKKYYQNPSDDAILMSLEL